MKKVVLGAAVALLMSAGLFAKTWTNNVGVGLSVPISMVSAKDPIFFDSGDTQATMTSTKDKTQFGFNVGAMYLGYHQSGFTVKGALSAGVGYMSDYWASIDTAGRVSVDPALGFNALESIGVGYSIVHTDKVVFALTGGVAFMESTYSEKLITNLVEDELTNSLFAFSLGGDATVILRSADGFGFFASVFVGWIPVGSVSHEQKVSVGNLGTSKTTIETDLKGNVIIAPTIGVSWTF